MSLKVAGASSHGLAPVFTLVWHDVIAGTGRGLGLSRRRILNRFSS